MTTKTAVEALATRIGAEFRTVRAEQVSSLLGGAGIDQVEINAFLSHSSDNLVVRKLVGDFTISAPILIGSNTLLDCTEARIELASGSLSRMLQTSQTPQTTTTGSMTTGQATVTTAVTLSSTLVGETLVISGAGGEGPRVGNDAGGVLPGAAAVHGRILSISGTTVTLDRKARATVTGATVKVFRRNKNVHILGGQWERLAGNNTIGKTITLERVDGFSIKDLSLVTSDSKYAIYIGDFSNGLVQNITLDVNSDGVSLSGPGERLIIENVHGHTDDDGISLLAASEYAGVDLGAESWGDLVDITIRNINLDGISAVAVVSSALATCDRILVDGVTHVGVDGTAKIGNWVGTGNLPIGSVTFRNIAGDVGGNGSGVVLTRGPSTPPEVRSLTIENVTYTGTTEGKPCVAIDGDIASLEMRGLYGNRALQVLSGSVIESGSLRGAVTTGGLAVVLEGKANLALSGIDHQGSQELLLLVSGATGSVISVDASNKCSYFFATILSGCDAHFAGDFGPNVWNTLNVDGTATVTAFSVTGSWGASAAKTKPRNLQYRVDVAKCVTDEYAMAHNTNPASGPEGPVIYRSGAWRSVWEQIPQIVVDPPNAESTYPDGTILLYTTG